MLSIKISFGIVLQGRKTKGALSKKPAKANAAKRKGICRSTPKLKVVLN